MECVGITRITNFIVLIQLVLYDVSADLSSQSRKFKLDVCLLTSALQVIN